MVFTNDLSKFILFDMNLEALRAIPKVELHRHLECSLRLSTFKELAQDLGLEVPADEGKLKEDARSG